MLDPNFPKGGTYHCLFYISILAVRIRGPIFEVDCLLAVREAGMAQFDASIKDIDTDSGSSVLQHIYVFPGIVFTKFCIFYFTFTPGSHVCDISRSLLKDLTAPIIALDVVACIVGSVRRYASILRDAVLGFQLSISQYPGRFCFLISVSIL